MIYAEDHHHYVIAVIFKTQGKTSQNVSYSRVKDYAVLSQLLHSWKNEGYMVFA